MKIRGTGITGAEMKGNVVKSREQRGHTDEGDESEAIKGEEQGRRGVREGGRSGRKNSWKGGEKNKNRARATR